jgi:hypothetical protein
VKTRTRVASIGILIAAAILISLPAAAAAADPSFAAGHGNTISGGELRTFSFSVVLDEDETVHGTVQVKNRSLDVRAHVEVDCVRFEPGARAIVSGPITQSSNPELIVPGRIGVFGVEDNGEGATAPADRITTIPDYAPPKSCNEFTFVDGTLRDVADLSVAVRTLTPIVAGNIQVSP